MCSDFLVTIVRSPLIESSWLRMIVISSRSDSTRAEIAGLSIAYLSPNHRFTDGCIRGKFFGAVLFFGHHRSNDQDQCYEKGNQCRRECLSRVWVAHNHYHARMRQWGGRFSESDANEITS